MKRKIITLMLCLGLITLATSSAIGMKINTNIKPLIKLGMLGNNEEDLGIATGGFLTEDSYEIEILDGSYFQIKKLERCLNNNGISFFNFVYVKNVDFKITYTKIIEDPENSTECYITVLYERNGFEIFDESDIVEEIVCIPHTVIVEGFTGWVFFSENVETWNSDGGIAHVSFLFFTGSYESIDLQVPL